MFVFVQIKFNWSDEFDIEGCFVSPKPHFESELETLKRNFDRFIKGQEFYFGTNQSISFSSYEDFYEMLEIKDCTEQFYDEFKHLSGGSGSFGENMFERVMGEFDQE